MRDEEYRAEQLPSYGAHEQPAIFARSARHRRTTLVGTVVAALGLAASVVSLVRYPDLEGSFVGRGWVVAMVSCSAAMLLVCGWQHVSWRRASQVWHGDSEDDLALVVAVSWVAHLLSYAAAVTGLVVSVVAIAELGWYATSAVLLMLALVALLVAQVLAGVQYVRISGPPGAVPAHMHRAVERQN